MTGSGVDPLLARLAAGDEVAFQKVHERFAGRLFGAALRMLAHRQDAEDAVQQVFTGFIRAREGLTEVNDLGAYLFTSLRHTAQKMATRARGQPIADTQLAADAAVTGSECPDESPRHERIRRCLACLPLKQREIIAIKIDGGLTFAQIGEVLGVSPNTAASRYRLALEKLRSALGGHTR
jgi:RNA polymerase sigma-70 factor (ECF subfamily)